MRRRLHSRAAVRPTAAPATRPRATATPGDARERPTAPCRELPCLTQLLAVWVMAPPAFVADAPVEQHHLK
ncbi:hypothetical protein [Streptomyces xanthochromogenes]|uniref:hypothetical protein n=1 Tax=Streptomyces xanthochromogenes TaxID=67384 RepID=UPI0034429AFA